MFQVANRIRRPPAAAPRHAPAPCAWPVRRPPWPPVPSSSSSSPPPSSPSPVPSWPAPPSPPSWRSPSSPAPWRRRRRRRRPRPPARLRPRPSSSPAPSWRAPSSSSPPCERAPVAPPRQVAWAARTGASTTSSAASATASSIAAATGSGAADFLADRRRAGLAAANSSAIPSSAGFGTSSPTSATLGIDRSMLRRAGAKLVTTSVTASPSFITSTRAARRRLAHQSQRHVAEHVADRDVGAVRRVRLDDPVDAAAHRMVLDEVEERQQVVDRTAGRDGCGALRGHRRGRRRRWRRALPPSDTGRRGRRHGHRQAGFAARGAARRRPVVPTVPTLPTVAPITAAASAMTASPCGSPVPSREGARRTPSRRTGPACHRSGDPRRTTTGTPRGTPGTSRC